MPSQVEPVDGRKGDSEQSDGPTGDSDATSRAAHPPVHLPSRHDPGEIERAGLAGGQPRPPDRDEEPASVMALVMSEISDAIIVTAPDGVIRGLNPAAERQYGLAEAAMVGRRFDAVIEALNLDGSPFRIAVVAELAATGSWRGRLLHRPREGARAGQSIVVETTLTPRRDEAGRFIGVIGLNRDVSDAARLEAELSALQSLAVETGRAQSRREIAKVGLDRLVALTGARSAILVALEGERQVVLSGHAVRPAVVATIEATPPSAFQIVGALATPGRVVTIDADDPPLSAPVLKALAAAGVRRGKLVGLVVQGRLEGYIGLGWADPETMYSGDALLVQAAGTIAGALENARLVGRLAASEERYRTLFEESPEAFRVETPEGEILDVNEAAARLYGRTRASLIGRNSGELIGIAPDELEQRRSELTQTGRGTFRGVGVRSDGSRFPEEIEARLVELDGRARALILVRDLSSEERLQQELLQAQKMEALGQLVSGVAHELNNPLTAILAFSQLWKTDSRLPDDMRHDAQLLHQEADRTRRIVKSLLDFARQRPPERQPTSVRLLIDSVLDLQAYALTASAIDVVVDVPPDVPSIEIDRAQLQQVLLNLTLNAIQAIRDEPDRMGRGRLELRSEAVPGSERPAVRISVIDDGPGVPPAFRRRLFDPFFTTKEPGKGTGLGLSVSFGIVAAHHGRLWFEPGEGGRGSRFIVELPVGRVDEELLGHGERRSVPRFVTAPVEAEGPTTPPLAVPAPSGIVAGPSETAATATPDERPAGIPEGDHPPVEERRPSVLVLDDEPSIRMFLAKALGTIGIDSHQAATGPEALDAIASRTFDVLLVDHRMAGMSGIEFEEHATALRPDLARRVVFMSGDVFSPELRSFADAKAVRLLAKPFDLEAARRVVREVLDAEGMASG